MGTQSSLTIGLISRIPPLPAGHHCQPARQARSLRAFSREPPSLVPTQRCCVGPARLGPRNNRAVLSTPKPRTHAAYAALDPLVWDPAAERPAAAEIGGRPHQFEMRPMLRVVEVPFEDGLAIAVDVNVSRAVVADPGKQDEVVAANLTHWHKWYHRW